MGVSAALARYRRLGVFGTLARLYVSVVSMMLARFGTLVVFGIMARSLIIGVFVFATKPLCCGRWICCSL